MRGNQFVQDPSHALQYRLKRKKYGVRQSLREGGSKPDDRADSRTHRVHPRETLLLLADSTNPHLLPQPGQPHSSPPHPAPPSKCDLDELDRLVARLLDCIVLVLDAVLSLGAVS